MAACLSQRRAVSVQTCSLSSGRRARIYGAGALHKDEGTVLLPAVFRQAWKKTQTLKGVSACLLITYYSSPSHLHSLTLWPLWSYRLTRWASLWNVGGNQVEERLKESNTERLRKENPKPSRCDCDHYCASLSQKQEALWHFREGSYFSVTLQEHWETNVVSVKHPKE